MAAPMVGHLDPYFQELIGDTMADLRRLFRTQNHHTIPTSGTGTAGLEMIVLNLLEPGDEAVIRGVRKSLAMKYPYMLNEAALVAGKVGDRKSIPRLRELLDHPFMAVRRCAAVALGMLGDTKSAPRLRKSLLAIRKREVLDHTRWGTELWFDENMRAAAAEGLGLMRDRESLPALRKALAGEPVPWVRKRISGAIARIERKR